MQRQPEELYELDLAAPDVDGAAILVHLDGFMDAGAAGRLLTEHLLENYEHETVARFDTDASGGLAALGDIWVCGA